MPIGRRLLRCIYARSFLRRVVRPDILSVAAQRHFLSVTEMPIRSPSKADSRKAESVWSGLSSVQEQDWEPFVVKVEPPEAEEALAPWHFHLGARRGPRLNQLPS